MNLRVLWNAGNFLTSCKPVSFSRRALHHGVSIVRLLPGYGPTELSGATMEWTYRDSSGIALLILNLCTGWTWGFRLTPRPLFTPWSELAVEASWNVMAHAQKPDFVFRRNGPVHLNRRERQFSRRLTAEVCASAVVMLDTPCSEVVWRVLATHSIRRFPLHIPPVRHCAPSHFNWTLPITY